MTPQGKNTLETILIVESDQGVRDVVRVILERAGYSCLIAASVEQAIRIESATKGEIHFLLSGVMIMGKPGPDLATLLKKTRPEMRVMFMSGYPHGEMLFLNYGWHFIEKPFVPERLVAKLKEILHTPDRSQGEAQFDTRVKLKASEAGSAETE